MDALMQMYRDCRTKESELCARGASAVMETPNGGIPSSLAGNDALEQMDISNNNIELQLPRSLLGSGFLRSINISHNGFHGDLPELPVFQFLESLDMSSNFLSGAIPRNFRYGGEKTHTTPTRTRPYLLCTL
ncbi:Leucine-rich repeat domain, L domain-like [Phytophthora cactorum]|nr:Leucine-rich repeat domain, L domain-like [Phytophthora cactorum]